MLDLDIKEKRKKEKEISPDGTVSPFPSLSRSPWWSTGFTAFWKLDRYCGISAVCQGAESN